jgi:hypothetical protein
MSTLRVLHEVFFDEYSARNYLISKRIFAESISCPKCVTDLRLDITRWSYRCRKRQCEVELSANNNTFFANTKLKLNEVLLLSKLWLSKVPYSSAVELTGHFEKTIVAHWKYLRQLVSSALDLEDTIIGGKGIIVEVDETKLGLILTKVKENITGVIT